MDKYDKMELDYFVEYILFGKLIPEEGMQPDTLSEEWPDNPWMEGCMVPDEETFDLRCGDLLPGLFPDGDRSI